MKTKLMILGAATAALFNIQAFACSGVINQGLMNAAPGITLRHMKFTTDDINVLRTIHSIEQSTDVVGSVLGSSPFAELFGSPAPEDLFITIVLSDWGKMPAAMKGVTKIEACKLQDLVEGHLVGSEGETPPTGKARQFFNALDAVYDSRCSGPAQPDPVQGFHVS